MDDEKKMFRFHAFGQSILYQQMERKFVYNYLNEMGKHNPHLITWKRIRGKSIPFVRDGKLDELRELLLRNIPQEKKYVSDRYMFLD